jgi:hypothetical protein
MEIRRIPQTMCLIALSIATSSCLTSGAPTGGAPSGPVSIFAPSVPSFAPPSPENPTPAASGMNGGGASSDEDKTDSGDSAAADKISEDPSGGSDAPIAIIGFPKGGSPKPGAPGPCNGDGYHLCFSKVTVTKGESAGEPGLSQYQISQYQISGALLKKFDDGTTVGMGGVRLLIDDVLFNRLAGRWQTDKTFAGTFDIPAVSPVGRGIRIEAEDCYHHIQVDLTTPDASASPSVVDQCDLPDPSDVYTPPSPSPSPEFPVIPPKDGNDWTNVQQRIQQRNHRSHQGGSVQP